MMINEIATIKIDGVYESFELHDEFVDWLTNQCKQHYKKVFNNNDRIYFEYTKDSYDPENSIGLRLQTIQEVINKVDISNFFVVIKTTNPNIRQEINNLKNISTDPVEIKFEIIDGEFQKEIIDKKPKIYEYGSRIPWKISLSELDDYEKELLLKSDTFCIYPWIHLHAHPNGAAYPCCFTKMNCSVGSVKRNTIKEIINSNDMNQLRLDMLSNKPNEACQACYEQEKHGFFSGRNSANKHHGHHISKVKETNADGSLNNFEMIYWDIRFSNLCNLSCRSCGHIFSSSWYKDQTILAGPEWAKNNKALQIAGRSETDMIEQLMEHIDCVEQIYFAGGEPLMMDEHYIILEELEKRKKFDVRLIYNTNFTKTKLKDREVFDFWRKFDSVSVGASLDAMGPHAEYIRKGTKWNEVVENRKRMMEICPNVDFYISATLSIMNVYHILDFHRTWVDLGLIEAKDFNINILLTPDHYRIDIAPKEYKKYLTKLYEQHLEWLADKDPLQRATNGFQSAISFMNAIDNSHLLNTFWEKTLQLDEIRNENIYDFIPEIENLHQ